MIKRTKNMDIYLRPVLLLMMILGVAAGCADFHSRPILPSQTAAAFESRSLENPELKAFLEKNLGNNLKEWPARSWDFEMLSLTAFYYHPDLDMARAKWGVAKAQTVTAGARPNPSVDFSGQHHSDTTGGLSPWTWGMSLDIPVETAGKRRLRVAQAQSLSEAGRLNIADVAWQVRSRLRTSLLYLYKAEQAETLLQKQQKVEEELAAMLKQRLALGEASSPEVTLAEISLNELILSVRDAEKQNAQARVQVASALGLPVDALQNIQISFDFIEQAPLTEDIPLKDLKRTAFLGRSDILSALSEYAASESALQLEIAKQYPDIHIGPGYTWNQGDNQWSLGVSLLLPVLNRNEGPIEEAKARRKETETTFLALQSRVNGEIDEAFAGYHSSLQKVKTADSLLSAKEKQVLSMQTLYDAGETDRLSLLGAQSEFYSIELSRLNALADAQQALGLLEDALKRPVGQLKSLPVPETNPRSGETRNKEAYGNEAQK